VVRPESVLRVDTAWGSWPIRIGNPNNSASSNHIPEPLRDALCTGLATGGIAKSRGGESGVGAFDTGSGIGGGGGSPDDDGAETLCK